MFHIGSRFFDNDIIREKIQKRLILKIDIFFLLQLKDCNISLAVR